MEHGPCWSRTDPRGATAPSPGARCPPVSGLDDSSPLTTESLFDLAEQPGYLVVLGGGPIGCEMAQAFILLGTRVTVIEREDRLLPRDEPEAGDVVRTVLERQGVDVRTGAAVTMVRRSPGSGRSVVHLEGSEPIDVDQVLVAAGRTPVICGLHADRAGVRLDQRGAVEVDATMATSAPGVWAVGDVTGGMQFTHAASRMAMVATANAFGRRIGPKQHFDESTVPWVTYVDPEVAHIGMTEPQASAHGGRVAWLPLEEVDRALTSGHTDGFVKLIAGPRRLIGNAGGGRLLGATIVAPTAGEMIHEIALAMRTNMFTGRLAQTVHAYPTWSTAIPGGGRAVLLRAQGQSCVTGSSGHLVTGTHPETLWSCAMTSPGAPGTMTL